MKAGDRKKYHRDLRKKCAERTSNFPEWECTHLKMFKLKYVMASVNQLTYVHSTHAFLHMEVTVLTQSVFSQAKPVK